MNRCFPSGRQFSCTTQLIIRTGAPPSGGNAAAVAPSDSECTRLPQTGAVAVDTVRETRDPSRGAKEDFTTGR